MQKVNVNVNDRNVVKAARKAAKDAEKTRKGHKGVFCGAAIELPDGRIVTGKNSPLLHAESSALLNAIKELANIPDNINLLPAHVIQNINILKNDVLNRKSKSLNLEETLIALAISITTNPMAELGLNMLKEIKNCEMHTTHLPSKGDEAGLIKLEINITTDSKLTHRLKI